MGENLNDLKEVLFFASKELVKINLSINSSKVLIFNNKEEFGRYWAFDIFNKLADPDNVSDIEQAVNLFFEYEKKEIKFKRESVLKRFLSCRINEIEISKRNKLFAILLEDDFISNLSEYSLERLYQLLPENDRIVFVNKLNRLIDVVLYNQFHYSLLKKADLLKIDKAVLRRKINELKF